MIKYWNDPKKTAKSITPDGWCKTGDLAQFTEDGYCKIVGRLKDILIRGGENVYPSEIEECLRHHPDVHDAQVIGQPDERLGETVRCVFIMKPNKANLTIEEVQEFCKDHLAHYKIPQYIDFTDEFPTTATKKVIKNDLRRQYNI
jgi:fatty-acyl-CoA synthase